MRELYELEYFLHIILTNSFFRLYYVAT